MEVLKTRTDALKKALTTLGEALGKKEKGTCLDYRELRDSIIKRFEYCSDTFWKYLKDYLLAMYSTEVEIARPKIVFRECHNTKILSDDELNLCLGLIEDRKLTSHTYNEDLAEEIGEKIPQYYNLMVLIFERCNKNYTSRKI